MTASTNQAQIDPPEPEIEPEIDEVSEAVESAAPDAGPAEADPSDSDAEAAIAPEELAPEELHAQALRVVEALIFASAEALSLREIAKRLPKSVDVKAILDELEAHYAPRGVTLVRIAGKVAFRTAGDIADRLKIERVQTRKLSRAALETLAIIAYQTAEDRPVTRSEIEEIRGVALSKGTLEVLMEAEFVGPKGNRETPGRPVTYAITDRFLEHFGLDSIKTLPGLKELRDLGLLDTRPAVSAYSEDSGLSNAPEMGEAAEAETGPIDDREIEAPNMATPDLEAAPPLAEIPPRSEQP
jgi:segregation and condensation protein B